METLRLRISNSFLGSVEASADGGATWVTIARVQHPAVDFSPYEGKEAASVVRSSSNGYAIATGTGHIFKVVPNTSKANMDPTAIVLNTSVKSWPFTELLPPKGSLVQLQSGQRIKPIPADYNPANEESLLIFISHPGVSPEAAKTIINDCASQYDAAVKSRLLLSKKSPTTGILTINVNLPEEEKIAALTYYVDGALIGIQNAKPFLLRQDTRKWKNGEHLIEVKAVDNSGAKITSRRTLVYVENDPKIQQP